MVNDLGNTDDLELMPTGGGYMVRRDRLMNELIVKGRKAGIVLLYAPDGFGKTSVLLQYVQEVKQRTSSIESAAYVLRGRGSLLLAAPPTDCLSTGWAIL